MLLEKLGFPRPRQHQRVEALSGGERRRLHLASVLAARPNLLILDEPTNDLDLQTVEVVEEWLKGYKGVLLVASHDRSFMDGVCDRLLVLRGDGLVRLFDGTYSEYRQMMDEEAEEAAAAAASAAGSSGNGSDAGSVTAASAAEATPASDGAVTAAAALQQSPAAPSANKSSNNGKGGAAPATKAQATATVIAAPAKPAASPPAAVKRKTLGYYEQVHRSHQSFSTLLLNCSMRACCGSTDPAFQPNYLP